VAVAHALEGGHAFGGDLRQIEIFARRGVVYTTLTHFFQKGFSSAPNAFPFFPDANAKRPAQGMSGLGLEAMAAMEDVGMVVDITHMSDHAVEDALQHARRPLLASHISSRTLADHPYAFYDEHIQEIARRGGLMGVILYPYILSNYGDDDSAYRLGSLDDTVRTVRYITKICGDHRAVGIGSDFSGYIMGPREMKSTGQVELLRERLQVEFEKDHSADQSREIVEDIMARNALRFLRENWRPAG
jgi:membrane dipeptidase